MSEHDALYQAILANPDDDLPRLVYADWLEENGRPDTAALIRVQCELARVPPWDPLWVRCKYLDDSWLTGEEKEPPNPRLPPGVEWAADRFRRGFPCRLRVDDPPFTAENADAIFQAAPVQELNFQFDRRLNPDLAELARHKRMSNVRSLEFSHGRVLPLDQLHLLLASPHLSGVNEWRFGEGTWIPDGLRELLTSSLAASLKHLRLKMTANAFTEADFLAAFGGAELPQLQRLTIPYAPFRWFPLHHLLASAHLPQLNHLEVGGPLGSNSLSQLCGWSGCSQINVLRLSNSELHAATVRQFDSGDWDNLRVLSLPYSPLRPDGVRALASAKWLHGLRVLDLSYAGIGDTGVRALADSPVVENLLALSLPRNSITDGGAKAILDSPHLGSLIYLNLDENNVSDDLRTALQQRFATSLAEYPRLGSCRPKRKKRR